MSDSIQFSYTYQTSVMLHTSPLFYLTVLICVGFTFSIDLFIETVKVNLLGRPSAFIRKEINTKGYISPEARQVLDRLVDQNDRKMARKDIEREEYLRERRMRKMEKQQRKIDRKHN
mmetsp:Transcript_36051/g.35655  ORF Transcript_36051/g.35655 Transcript_36051/m.35655 type:complete len:117 (-) Transcript_36051:17-367(-)